MRQEKREGEKAEGEATGTKLDEPEGKTLERSRAGKKGSGKFMTLVATNVATRGLDINDVQLIIQCEPPRNSGAAVMLYDPRRSNFSKIERECGVKFEHISPPQPAADVAKVAGIEAAEIINQISDSVIPAFKAAAEDLLNTSGLSVVELLSKALAKAAVTIVLSGQYEDDVDESEDVVYTDEGGNDLLGKKRQIKDQELKHVNY
ncbi:hypothetical protein F8388_019947 [Cannabis sativa]|uniref:RNA helicase n=1 Tax=Cannabis sativa TaxID=3483 RepID=A0A7J6H4U2_CANSA|nr:hypothetical protein F8388_019947 [Cannabis sativa]